MLRRSSCWVQFECYLAAAWVSRRPSLSCAFAERVLSRGGQGLFLSMFRAPPLPPIRRYPHTPVALYGTPYLPRTRQFVTCILSTVVVSVRSPFFRRSLRLPRCRGSVYGHSTTVYEVRGPMCTTQKGRISHNRLSFSFETTPCTGNLFLLRHPVRQTR